MAKPCIAHVHDKIRGRAQLSACVGSRDTSQGRWEGHVAVVWLPDFVARLVRQVRRDKIEASVNNGFPTRSGKNLQLETLDLNIRLIGL